jgi:hypothetical protein
MARTILTAFLLALQLSACTQVLSPSQPEHTPVFDPTETPPPVPTATLTLAPTLTPKPQVSIQDALLVDVDFESGTSNIRDWAQVWGTRGSDDGNTVYCNSPGDDWTSFQFGSESWSDYAVEADVQLVGDTGQPGYEMYVRLDSQGEGYRATLYNKSDAAMNYYPPFVDFGGSSVSISIGDWHTLKVEVVSTSFKYYVDDELITTFEDDRRNDGLAGIGASPGTEICVDNVRLWAIDENGAIARENIPGAVDPSDPLAKYEGECVFCFVDGSDPDMPIWDNDRQGWTHQPDDPREQVILDETFFVGAGDEVVFENKIIWIRPNHRADIEVYGTLVIRDSLLLWDQTEHLQTRLRVKNGGTLIAESSYAFWGNQYWVYWEYESGSTIKFDHFVGNPWCSIHGSVDYTAVNYSTVKLTFLNDTHDTSVNVSDAHHVWFELFPPAGEHVITLPAKREWGDWLLTDIWPNTTVTVQDSYLYERDMSISNDTHVTVRDTPDGFSLGWAIAKESPGFVECELSELGDPNDDDGVFYERMTWDLPCNNSSLTVENSVLQRAWPVTWGYVHLRIRDSNLVDPRNYGGPATMEIYTSTIDHIAAYRGGVVYVEDTRIRYDIEVKDLNSVIYGYNISARDASREIEIIEVDGGSFVELDTPGPPWQ